MEKSEKENKISKTSDLNTNDKEFKINDLINSVFKDKCNKAEIIEKLRPFFTLRVIPQREIDKIYSAVEKINPEKIDLIEEFKYEEEKYDSKNIFETKSKSVGLSDFDLDLSLSIFGQKQGIKLEERDDKINNNLNLNAKIHCIHSIVVSLFRIVIDFKEIKLAKQVLEELSEVENSNETDKKLLLEKLVDKFGLYVPLEILVGGRINYSFDANNDEEIKEIHNILQSEIKAKFGGNVKGLSVGFDVKKESKSFNDKLSQKLDKIENLSIKMEGGDYTYKEDFQKWIQSFNMDNLQIIEYKTLIPIYCFVQGLESKLTICLQKYEDIALKEIYNLMEKEFKNKEKELFQGNSENINSWKIGITNEIYKSFIIYKKKFVKKLKIPKNSEKNEKKEKNVVKDVICGQIPDGFTICGWVIKTNSNSKPYDVICNWERKKDLQIIGNDCFKFKVDLNAENTIDEDIEIDWILEIYCIHTDFLVQYNSSIHKNYNDIEHYFLYCDCCTNNTECYYKEFYTKENWRKLDQEELKNLEKEALIRLQNKAHKSTTTISGTIVGKKKGFFG